MVRVLDNVLWGPVAMLVFWAPSGRYELPTLPTLHSLPAPPCAPSINSLKLRSSRFTCDPSWRIRFTDSTAAGCKKKSRKKAEQKEEQKERKKEEQKEEQKEEIIEGPCV